MNPKFSLRARVGLHHEERRRPPAGIAGIAVMALMACIAPAEGASYYFALDSPAVLGGSLFTASQFLFSDGSMYAAATPAGSDATQYRALHRKADGSWLFTLSRPGVVGGGISVDARVVLLDDGTTTSLYFDGGAAGLPVRAGLDALFLDGADLILSLDAPVRLGGVEYSPSDLVRFTGGVPSLFWDAEAAGVPSRVNVVGADRDPSGTLVLTFDVPVILAGARYTPGQLVAWTGSSFSLYSSDPGWPISAQLRDFSLLPAAGGVPGEQADDTPMTVARNPVTGEVTLSWDSSCNAADDDFEIYEGALIGPPSFYTHTQKLCSTAGATSATFPEPAGNSYWLVVPRNAVAEGSYGHRSTGMDRPVGSTVCLPQQIGACP